MTPPSQTDDDSNTQRESNGSVDDIDFDFQRTLTDELYEELSEVVVGEKIVGLALWEASLADDEEAGEPAPDERVIVDLDLYLENKFYLELYGTLVFPDPQSDPLQGLEQIGKMVSGLIEQGVWLDEIAATEEDELVLILYRERQPQLYLNVGGWTLSEWETLPSDN